MIWLLTTYAIFSQLFFTINFQLTCASFDQWWEREQILGGKGSSGWSFPETFIPSEWSQPSAAADCSRTCYSLKERWMSVVAQCCWGVCFLFSWLVLWTRLPSAFERGIVSGLCISPTGAGWMRMMGWMCDKRTGGLERKIKTWLQYRVGAFFVCFFLSGFGNRSSSLTPQEFINMKQSAPSLCGRTMWNLIRMEKTFCF